MSLTVKEGATFKKVTPGTYQARCIKVIDLGTIHSEYQGKPRTRQQVLITFELPTELIEEGEYAGQPYTISKFYTASLDEKATLRKDLEAWRGRPFTKDELNSFDLKKVLGAPCMISVVHSEAGKEKISAVMSVMKGVTVPQAINKFTHFDLSVWDAYAFDALPEWIQGMIHESDEYKEMAGLKEPKAGEPGPVMDSEIPF
jgi:hypothetical protein